VGEGGVWVASGDGTVDRIDPGSGDVTRAPVRVAAPGGIAAGEGSVWVTSSSDGTVTRIDPATLTAIGDPIEVGARPADVAVGAGSAWVANTDDGTVTRIDAGSGEAGDPIPVADQRVLALTFGEDGVWLASTDDPEARPIEIKRIDPVSGSLDDSATPLPDAAIPIRLAAGEGAVWATLAGGVIPPGPPVKPGVAVLDPDSRDLTPQPVPVGDRPAGIAVGEGAVWVANSGDGTVTRIVPAG
jgi:YVTN family beta-propeller protein